MKTQARFGAPWGAHLKIITPLVTLLLAIGALLVVWAPLSYGAKGFALLVLGSLLLAAPCFSVLGYEVEPGRLSILRPGWRTSIPLDGLRGVEADAGAMNSSLRLMGNGGFWSFTGLYWNRRLGKFRAFVSDPRRAVALRFDRRCLVVSPESTEDFVRCLQSEIKVGG